MSNSLKAYIEKREDFDFSELRSEVQYPQDVLSHPYLYGRLSVWAEVRELLDKMERQARGPIERDDNEEKELVQREEDAQKQEDDHMGEVRYP